MGSFKKFEPEDASVADRIADEVYDSISDDFTSLPIEARAALEQSVLAGPTKGIIEIKLANTAMVSKLNQIAREWAAERAAEMVGMKYDAEEKLVPNPSAKWAISETTRDELRQIIKKAFEEETEMPELVKRIQAAGAFSDARARTIARTEVSNAQIKGNLEVWKESGLVQKVKWMVSSLGPCPICAGNANQVVEFGEAFPSGDTSPLAHPNCRCILAAVQVSSGEPAFE